MAGDVDVEDVIREVGQVGPVLPVDAPPTMPGDTQSQTGTDAAEIALAEAEALAGMVTDGIYLQGHQWEVPSPTGRTMIRLQRALHDLYSDYLKKVDTGTSTPIVVDQEVECTTLWIMCKEIPGFTDLYPTVDSLYDLDAQELRNAAVAVSGLLPKGEDGQSPSPFLNG